MDFNCGIARNKHCLNYKKNIYSTAPLKNVYFFWQPISFNISFQACASKESEIRIAFIFVEQAIPGESDLCWNISRCSMTGVLLYTCKKKKFGTTNASFFTVQDILTGFDPPTDFFFSLKNSIYSHSRNCRIYSVKTLAKWSILLKCTCLGLHKSKSELGR